MKSQTLIRFLDNLLESYILIKFNNIEIYMINLILILSRS